VVQAGSQLYFITKTLVEVSSTMSGFVNALEVMSARQANPRLTTGDADLDSLVGGGVERGQFYLFYGDEESGVDNVIHGLIVNALLPPERFGFGGKSLYVNCGNYRYERTMLDTELLCRLIKSAKLDPACALESIYSICVFSEGQEEKAFNEILKLLQKDPEIKLVAVHNIAKLFTATEGTPNRNAGERIIRFQRVIHEIWQACAEKNLAFAASCRPKGGKNFHVRVPPPEGGSYLRHEATVIAYFERKGGGYVSAYLVKHPNRANRKVDLKFGGDVLGRVTVPFRTLLKEEMDNLKRTYREVLIDARRREAFDSLVQAWSSEQGAMSYVRVPTLDAMLLTAVVDNRRLVEDLVGKVEAIRSKLEEIERRLEKISD